MPTPEFTLLLVSIGGVSLGLIGGALALGIRHGIDWDHIAAITDITSTTAATPSPRETVLTFEPGLMLTDERDHSISSEKPAHAHGLRPHEHATERAAQPSAVLQNERVPVMVARLAVDTGTLSMRVGGPARVYDAYVGTQARPWLLGTLYALGHATVVTILGLIAILAASALPEWIDPVMERVVGVTLVILSMYLFYSVYRYFRGSGEFRLRSRWMLVFAGVRNGYEWCRTKLRGTEEHTHVRAADNYGWKTAYGIGMIHGIGAETGTQALIIATAAGASSKSTSVVVLLTFVVGLLISNSAVTLMSTTGFVSASRRQWLYVAAGLVAAVFSLIIGVFFLAQSGGALPDPGRYFEWIGGPSTD